MCERNCETFGEKNAEENMMPMKRGEKNPNSNHKNKNKTKNQLTNQPKKFRRQNKETKIPKLSQGTV